MVKDPTASEVLFKAPAVGNDNPEQMRAVKGQGRANGSPDRTPASLRAKTWAVTAALLLIASYLAACALDSGERAVKADIKRASLSDVEVVR